MKKSWRLLAALLAALLLGGCLQGTPGQGTARPPVQAPSAAQPEEGAPYAAGTVRVLLPSDRGDVRTLLEAAAATDGIVLQIRTAAGGELYAQAVADAMAAEDAPDLVWLENEAGFWAAGGSSVFANLLGQGSATAAALASLVPATARFGGEEAVCGLPLGFYTEGYLVNIETLAALLGTENHGKLREDLQACSFEQWRLLALYLEQYLQKPGRIRITLGATTYTTANYRPKQAQPLRGIFAVADADGAALVGNGISIAASLPFGGQPAPAETTEEEQAAFMEESLTALFGLLEFETAHMGRREGSLRRGELYAELEKNNAAEAEALFAGGTALFLRADSRTGLRLEAENPALAGKLALVPVKLPLEPELAEPEDAPAKEAEEEESASSEADESEAGTEEEAEEDEDEIDVPAAIEAQNQTLWWASDGYLCVNKKTAETSAASALLLQLFTTEAGMQAIEDGLRAHPFTRLHATGTLAAQTAAAVNDKDGLRLGAGNAAVARAKSALGTHLAENLLEKEGWEQSDLAAFLATGLLGLGLRV